MSDDLPLRTVLSALDDPRAVNAVVRAFCAALLERAEFELPDGADPSSERITFVRLSESDAKAADNVRADYERWLKRCIERYKTQLPGSEINLLRANADEIVRYITMSRRGADVTQDLYKQLYLLELDRCLDRQSAICDGAVETDHTTTVAGKRRHCGKVPLTIGVEEEYQIVSTSTWDLQPDVDRLLNSVPKLPAGSFGREVYKSQIEMSTPVCKDVHELAAAITDARRMLRESLPDSLAVLSAGSHPFAKWNSQLPSDSPRTQIFMHDMQDVVRRLLTFGLHVHVGIDDPNLALVTLNGMRRYLPLLLALSASSPLWEGRVTGLASYRSTVFSGLPRTGIPPLFENRHELHDYCRLLAETSSFDSLGTFDTTKLWWDARLHPKYPTLEIRICDACPLQADAVSIAALCQALSAKITKVHREGLQVIPQTKQITEENKWRAVRYGRRATFIDDIRRDEVPATYYGLQALDFVDDVVDDLGSRPQVERIISILENGTGADLQMAAYRETNDVRAVARRLAAQFTVLDSTPRATQDWIF